MDRATQISALEELAGLNETGSAYLDEHVVKSDIGRYLSQDRFADEQAKVFQRTPLIAAHVSELSENGAFKTMRLAGKPVLITRDRDGQVHAFLNVCRHRGARLVDAESGCKNSFSCPYHAWTWSNDGTLRGVPHEKQGFPDLDKSAYGLKRLPVAERHGFIWVIPSLEGGLDMDAFLDPLEGEFDWIDMEDHGIAVMDQVTIKANWKILVEGGIEAYHFKVAHKDTIGPHFIDNLSSYRMLGRHMRSVLPRISLEGLKDVPQESWNIRENANVLYSIFPLNQFLVMQDHVAWISATPVSAGETVLKLGILAPRDEITEANATHWARNQKITTVTLTEDFEIGEAIQDGLASGANEALSFGRYEGALDAFNRQVEDVLAE